MNYHLPQVGLAWLFVLMFLEKNKGKSVSKVWRFLCILFFFYFFNIDPAYLELVLVNFHGTLFWRIEGESRIYE